MKDFFLSYTSHDRRWAEWIAWTLEEVGYTVVIQAWDFKAGEDFIRSMNKALTETRKVIAVLSQEYFDATYTNAEWGAAFAKDPTGSERFLLPIRIRNCQLPPLLMARIYIDLVGLTEKDARIAVVNAAYDRSERPASRPGFPGHGVGRSPDVLCDESVPKPYPGETGTPITPHLGPIVAKSCDRDEQEEAFDKVFRERIKRHRGCPQMYIVHGPVRERHSSLVDRWRETLIQEYANYLSGKLRAAVTFWAFEKWPTTGKLETDLGRLIEWLIVKCDPKSKFELPDYTPQAFHDLLPSMRKQVIVVQHEIDAEQFTPDTPRLIEQYLKFWGTLKVCADSPQFLIFLNVKYPAIRVENRWKIWEVVKRFRRARDNMKIASALGEIGILSHQRTSGSEELYCSYTFLKELPCVKLKDVEAWLKKYRLGKNEVAWETQSQNIFRLRGWKLNEAKNMAEVEDALEEFIAASAENVGWSSRIGANL